MKLNTIIFGGPGINWPITNTTKKRSGPTEIVSLHNCKGRKGANRILIEGGKHTVQATAPGLNNKRERGQGGGTMGQNGIYYRLYLLYPNYNGYLEHGTPYLRGISWNSAMRL